MQKRGRARVSLDWIFLVLPTSSLYLGCLSVRVLHLSVSIYNLCNMHTAVNAVVVHIFYPIRFLCCIAWIVCVRTCKKHFSCDSLCFHFLQSTRHRCYCCCLLLFVGLFIGNIWNRLDRQWMKWKSKLMMTFFFCKSRAVKTLQTNKNKKIY